MPNPEQKARLEELFDILEDIPTDARVWIDATDLAWDLDRRGDIVPLSDVVIAACARISGATVITTDHHFSRVPGLSVAASVPRFE